MFMIFKINLANLVKFLFTKYVFTLFHYYFEMFIFYEYCYLIKFLNGLSNLVLDYFQT